MILWIWIPYISIRHFHIISVLIQRIPYQLPKWCCPLLTELLLRNILQPTLHFPTLPAHFCPLCREVFTVPGVHHTQVIYRQDEEVLLQAAICKPCSTSFYFWRVTCLHAAKKRKERKTEDTTWGSTGPGWISVHMRRKKNWWVTTATSNGKEEVSTENVCWLQGTAVNSGCQGDDCRKRPR